MKATDRIREITGALVCKHCDEELSSLLVDVEELAVQAKTYHESVGVYRRLRQLHGMRDPRTDSAMARMSKCGIILNSTLEDMMVSELQVDEVQP